MALACSYLTTSLRVDFTKKYQCLFVQHINSATTLVQKKFGKMMLMSCQGEHWPSITITTIMRVITSHLLRVQEI